MQSDSPRLAPLAEADWSEEQRQLLEAGRMGGRVLNIFRTLVRHPKLLKRWLVFGNHILNKSTLAPRERELVILRIGWLCRCEYEWSQHVIIGKSCGLDDSDIRRVKTGPGADGLDPFDDLLLRAVDELHSDAFIGAATWRELAGRLSEEQLLDLIFTVGQYNLVSMALNSLGVPLDDGIPGDPEIHSERNPAPSRALSQENSA
jgi:alkylhydroperoxidase family enzyme